MKILNYTIIIKLKLLSIITIIMLTQSCVKEEYDKVEHKTNYYYLTAAQLNQTPYFTNPAFDTISFTSDKGDTLTFVKTKTDTTWYCENGSGNPNTGYDEDCYQTIHNNYITIKGNGSFDVEHGKKVGPYNNFIIIEFNNTSIFINDWIINDKTYPTFISNYTVKNKVYSNVLRKTINDNTQNTATSYLNQTFGLFYFENLISIDNFQLLR